MKHRRAAFFAGSVDSVVCVPKVLEKAQEKKSVELRDISLKAFGKAGCEDSTKTS